jgi:hypothetical protein
MSANQSNRATTIYGDYMFQKNYPELKNLDFNENATILAHELNVIYPSDYIVGDILVVDLDEFDGLPYE